MGGAYEPIVHFSNYSKDELTTPDYVSLQRMEIMGKFAEDGSTSIYNSLEVYTKIPDIKSLTVSYIMRQIAEDEGVDWYEYWPELESVEVFE